MIYEIVIKSHTDAPDYEDSVEAINLEEATDYFHAQLKGEVERRFIEENIYCEEEDVETEKADWLDSHNGEVKTL